MLISYGVGWGGGGVAHEILVSAQGPLVLGFWLWGLRVWGLGLTKTQKFQGPCTLLFLGQSVPDRVKNSQKWLSIGIFPPFSPNFVFTKMTEASLTIMYSCHCQALVPTQPSAIQFKTQISPKGTEADTKIIGATPTTPPKTF